MTKGSNHVGSPPRVPTTAKGNDYLTPGRQPGQTGAPPAKVHREPHSPLVKVRDGDNDGK
jgi:hypothetical protein